MNQRTLIKKLALASVLTAVAVVGSTFPSRCSAASALPCSTW